MKPENGQEGKIQIDDAAAMHLAEIVLLTVTRLAAERTVGHTDFNAFGLITRDDVDSAYRIIESLEYNGLAVKFTQTLAAIGLQEHINGFSPDDVLTDNQAVINEYIEDNNISVDDKALLFLARELRNFPISWIEDNEGYSIIDYGWKKFGESIENVAGLLANGASLKQLSSAITGESSNHHINSNEEEVGMLALTAFIMRMTEDSQELFRETLECLANGKALPGSKAAKDRKSVEADIHNNFVSG